MTCITSLPPAEVKNPTKTYEESDNRAQCMQEIRAFLKGGECGAQRLKEVLPSLFSYYKIVTTEGKGQLLVDCGLSPYISETNDEVTFVFRGVDESDQFNPKGVQRSWVSRFHDGYLGQCLPEEPRQD